MTLQMLLDEYGRALIGKPNVVDILDNPSDSQIYYGWEGMSEAKPGPWKEEVAEHVSEGSVYFLGGVLILTYSWLVAVLILVDKILGKTGIHSLRFKFEHATWGPIDWKTPLEALFRGR